MESALGRRVKLNVGEMLLNGKQLECSRLIGAGKSVEEKTGGGGETRERPKRKYEDRQTVYQRKEVAKCSNVSLGDTSLTCIYFPFKQTFQ